MSERGSFRGGQSRGRGSGGGRGGGDGGRGGRHHQGQGQHRGGHQGQSQGQTQGQQQEKPKKENILDLTKYMDKEVNVKFNGGREVTGVLKGYDQLMNLVLDDVKETMRDDNDNVTTRSLGLIVARGTLLVLLSPADGSEEIANPFVQQEDE
ncbi:RH73529p [Nannizzia gypsea CBS 118893]|uniref:RH73529p n=1 Tax=Arthroderma gypseum (strain ATCC MYA-4604 / CBS 118893) TaxID=535722 RepID=E4V212_ARTGP|nr:RH73529p [Nannizzia gypsea CBS 118893]EFR04077.1 RH73529p [Nannizzia gypsea CBS 118893]